MGVVVVTQNANAADEWGDIAIVSSTLGVNSGSMCIGEGTRGELGCPTYAPFVSSTGLVGLATTTPSVTLTVSGSAFSNSLMLKSITGAAAPSAYASGLWTADGVNTYYASGRVGMGGAPHASYGVTVNNKGTGNGLLVANALAMGTSGGAYDSIGYNLRFTNSTGVYQYQLGDKSSMIRFGSSGVGIETFTTGTVGSAGGTIAYTAGPFIYDGGTSWTSSSDRRLKKDIETLSVLDKLDGYRAVSFNWKQSGKRDIGVIAQELYPLFPEVVYKGSDTPELDKEEGKWGVDYDKLGALALEGVKELHEENKQLRAEVAELKQLIEKQAKQ